MAAPCCWHRWLWGWTSESFTGHRLLKSHCPRKKGRDARESSSGLRGPAVVPVPPAGRHPRARGPAAQPHCPHRAPCAFSLCLLSPQSAYCRPRVKIHSRAAHTFLVTPGCPLQSFALPWEEAVVRPMVECGDACVLPPQSSPVGTCLLVLRQRKGRHATDGPCQTEVLLRRHLLRLSSQAQEPPHCHLSGFWGCPTPHPALTVTGQETPCLESKEPSLCHCLTLRP